MSLNSTQELIKEIQNGKMIILMDDEDRENEGDLVIAASCISSEDINFMARYGRGLICLTLTDQHCKKLNLPLMTNCLLYTSPSPRDLSTSRMPSSA